MGIGLGPWQVGREEAVIGRENPGACAGDSVCPGAGGRVPGQPREEAWGGPMVASLCWGVGKRRRIPPLHPTKAARGHLSTQAGEAH